MREDFLKFYEHIAGFSPSYPPMLSRLTLHVGKMRRDGIIFDVGGAKLDFTEDRYKHIYSMECQPDSNEDLVEIILKYGDYLLEDKITTNTHP